ncbi:polysaccharide biosynthesis protein [Alkalibacillus haloalkaliphilus]|uniref:Putative membrane protein YabM n=1 Tax=Alkalibacillus haloalkaliphilus TaxID=94136 RepID=A0A511W0W5_9BACI|nr:polysaccharide biosynthesis protein [Alkalibacillus haloalkaliphilus]GEN44739.1 putative membrane protein YabM [Alkalibacillus haloalkaliphilus]
MSNSSAWIKGTVILTIAALIGKVLGMVYRIPLQNLAGDEGLYVYQQIYPVISLALMLSIYSLPSAFSHVLTYYSPQNAQIRFKNVSVVFYLLVTLGFMVALTLYVASPFLVNLMGDDRLLFPFKMTSLLFLLIPITAFFRGYFQFKQQEAIFALSQVTEQLIRVLLIVVSTIIIVNYGLSVYNIGWLATVATLAGVVFAILVLLFFYFKYRKTTKETVSLKLKKVLVPLITGMVVYSLTHVLHLIVQFVDVLTMVNSLKEFGNTFTEAVNSKGVYDRGNPLVQLGLVFGSALALSIVPAIQMNEPSEQKVTEWNQVFAFKLTFLFSLSAAFGLVAIMPVLNPLFYLSSDGTVAIQLMMVLVFLFSMIMTLSVLLQGHGIRVAQVKWLALLLVVKWMLNILLIQQFGIIGASLASVIATGLIVIVFYRLWSSRVVAKGINRFLVKASAVVLLMTTVVYSLNLLARYFVALDERLLLLLIVIALCFIGAVIVLYCIDRIKLFTDEEQAAINTIPLIKKLRKLGKYGAH